MDIAGDRLSLRRGSTKGESKLGSLSDLTRREQPSPVSTILIHTSPRISAVYHQLVQYIDILIKFRIILLFGIVVVVFIFNETIK